jgi:hypothetical protein
LTPAPREELAFYNPLVLPPPSASAYQPVERQNIIGRVGQFVHAIWDAVK